MLWFQFVLQNAHFAIHLLTALAFFCVFWLYFDAWIGRKTWREVPRLAGYLLLALSFVVSAGSVETAIVQAPLLGVAGVVNALTMLRLAGYGLVLWGVGWEPLQANPNLRGWIRAIFHQPR